MEVNMSYPTIWFKIINNDLILYFCTEFPSVANILSVLKEKGVYSIKHTFFVKPKHIYIEDNVEDFFVHSIYDGSDLSDRSFDVISFIVGTVFGDYIKIYPEILNTQHTFYFHRGMKITSRLFISSRNISILKKIDSIIDSDVFIGGNEIVSGYIPEAEYELLLQNFPGTTELDHYTNARISNILAEYFENAFAYVEKYQKYLKRKRIIKSSAIVEKHLPNGMNSSVYESSLYKLEQFRTIYADLSKKLSVEQHVEADWQEYIQQIILILFPKYIISIPKVRFEAIDNEEDRYKREPDFTLIDSNGFVDVLEIKKPDVEIISPTKYRNNHLPMKELAGAIVQIEKYLYCITQSSQKSKSRILAEITKRSIKIPEPFNIRVINPQGILILGREHDFTISQKRDFELIKRQYKHIVDIMTYDDLLQRLRNIIFELEAQLRI